jgi:hypothetical protein
MNLPKGSVYPLLFFTSAAGYAWIFLNWQTQTELTVCPMKSITGIPCPSCGSTRSVLAIFKGAFQEALWLNPIGFLVAFVLIISPIWMVFDTFSQRNTLEQAYEIAEKTLRKPTVFIPLILLLLANWIWNLQKAGILW